MSLITIDFMFLFYVLAVTRIIVNNLQNIFHDGLFCVVIVISFYQCDSN